MLKKEMVFIRSVAKKLKCIKYKGGVCIDCGINLVDSPWIAHFHHRNPSEKEFGITAVISSALSLFKIADELDKCDLLCGNCHARRHFSWNLFVEHKDKIYEKVDSLDFSNPHLDNDSIQKIIECAHSGLSLKEIAEQTGFCVPIIAFIARKYVPEEKFGNDKIRKITDSQLKQEVESGKSLRSIALIYNMGYKTVWKRWKKMNDPEYSWYSC